MSGSRNAWTWIKNVNGASRLSNFWNFFGVIQMICRHEWWPWTKSGYITMTQIQTNNQWNGGIAAHPAPKYSECKNPLEKFSPWFFGIKMATSYWLSSKRPNYQRGVLLISAGATEGHFEGKMLWEGHQGGGLVLAWQCPGSPGTCNTDETGLPGLPCLDHPPNSLDLALLDYHLFPGLKKQLKGHHFLSDVEVIVAAEIWLDGQPSEFFFEWLAKVRATG